VALGGRGQLRAHRAAQRGEVAAAAAGGAQPLLYGHDGGHLVEEPGVDVGDRGHLLGAQAQLEDVAQVEQVLGPRGGQLALHHGPPLAEQVGLDVVGDNHVAAVRAEAGAPLLQTADRLLQRLAGALQRHQ